MPGAEAIPAPRPRVLVVAALVRQDGLVLMSRRRPDQSFPLCWEFPGGKIDPGESPGNALQREIREELGCDARVGAIFEVVFHAYDDFDLFMLVYDCTLAGAPAAVQVQAIQWFEPLALPALALPPADHPLALRLAAESAR